MMPCIAVDARMIGSSGIGRVTASILTRCISMHPDWQFVLLGDSALIRKYVFDSGANISIVRYIARPHSLREQLTFPYRELNKCDMLWSPNYNIPIFWRGRLMVNIHDVAHLALTNLFGSFIKRNYARFMFRLVQRHANGIVYVSQFSKDEFHRYVGAPLHASEAVALNGVGNDWFEIQRGEALRAHPYILFVGNVKPHKNLGRLLMAFMRVKDLIPHDLIIVGKKSGFIVGDNSVFPLVEKLGDRVVFTDRISDGLLKRYFAQADALVLPSLYEGFGLTPLEAMAAGCPALVSQVASLTEVCLDAALYCDPYDVNGIAKALQRIVTDQDLRSSLRKKGLQRAGELSWDTSVAGYLGMIESLLVPHGG